LSSPATPGEVGSARIVEESYRRYRSARTGPYSAALSVAAQTARRVLGLRRPARSKVLPWLVVGLAYLRPVGVIAAAALAAQTGVVTRESLADSVEFVYTLLSADLLVAVFAAWAGAEALCPDRRDGLVTYYLVSRLDRTRYLAAKFCTVAGLVLLITAAPALLQVLGLTFLGFGSESFASFLELVAKTAVGGLIVAVPFSLLAMALSSLIDRTGVAVAATIGTVLSASVVSALLAETEAWTHSYVISPYETVRFAVGKLSSVPDWYFESWEVSTLWVAAAWVCWTALPALVTVERMRRLRIAS
jgi:ABC-2 type transport system permease protein